MVMFYGHSVVDEMADKYYGYGWFMDNKQQPNELWHFGGPLGAYAYLKVIKHLKMSIYSNVPKVIARLFFGIEKS